MANPEGKNEKILTDKTEVEVVDLYRDPSVKMTDILESFGISQSTLYTLLKREHVPLRKPGRGGSERTPAYVAYLLKRITELEAENATLKGLLSSR
jgi:hypothetical protein